MKKYNLSEIMKRAWQIKKTNGNNIFSICLKMAWNEAKATSEMTLKEKLISKMDFVIANASTAYYMYNASINEWENYGKSRTYFSIWEKANNSRHNVKYDYGYFDNKTNTYVPGKLDLTKNYNVGGKNHLDCAIAF